jgi:hypothetical protein
MQQKLDFGLIEDELQIQVKNKELLKNCPYILRYEDITRFAAC